MFGVSVKGSELAVSTLNRLADEGRAGGRARPAVISTLPYAFGIETGRHRGGRLARRAGGARMFRRGAASVRSQGLKPVRRSGAILDGVATVVQAAEQIAVAVKALTPVKTGALRDSIRVVR